MSGTELPTWLQSAARPLAADPKKSAFLALLLTVLGVLVARQVFGSHPANVSAMPARETATGLTPLAPATAAPVQPTRPGGESLAAWASHPVGPLDRNLFLIQYDYYASENSRTAPDAKPVDDGFWDRLEKSLAQHADQRKERQILIENLQSQAAQLKLQSTVNGSQPKAIINGTLVKEGDVVASFRVVKIEARRIVVEREGIQLEIRMN